MKRNRDSSSIKALRSCRTTFERSLALSSQSVNSGYQKHSQLIQHFESDMSTQLSLPPKEEIEEPAQDCASSNLGSSDSELQQFTELQVEAKKYAKVVASTCMQHHQAAWDGLLPILDKMQKLLSERGANHKQATNGLPGWGFWWHDFSLRNNLNISFRTVQYRLNRLREASSSRKQHGPRLTRQEQIDLARTAWEGHQLASVSITGIGGVDAAKSFYRCCLPLEAIQEIQHRLSARRGRPLPKDRAARVKSIAIAAGPRIRENIAGLDAAEAADILQDALSSIIERFCPAVGVSVHIECIALKREVEAEPVGASVDREVA